MKIIMFKLKELFPTSHPLTAKQRPTNVQFVFLNILTAFLNLPRFFSPILPSIHKKHARSGRKNIFLKI